VKIKLVPIKNIKFHSIKFRKEIKIDHFNQIDPADWCYGRFWLSLKLHIRL